MISVLGQCASCCECPTATVEWDSVSATKDKSGFLQGSGYETTPPKRYLTATGTGIEARSIGVSNFASFKYTGTLTLDADEAVISSTKYITATECITTVGYPFTCDSTTTDGCVSYDAYAQEIEGIGNQYAVSETEFSSPFGGFSCGDVIHIVLSNEYTNLLLRSNAIAVLPAYDSDWNDTAGSVLNLSTDELSAAIRESRYRLRFSIPKTNTGTNFRATWVERFIPEAGTTISSVSVHSAGVYRPTVTLSAPPTGGTQAYAIAVMSSTGTISSILILHPGFGYTSAPTVTVQAATGGGTSSTGWVATLTAGQVTSIGSGSAGDYRPTLAFSGGGGSSATATCTLDAVGGIAAVTVTAAGSAYTSEPTLTITPKVTSSTAADLLIHLGTETAKCTVWDGATPGGYAEGTPSTWPILPSAAPYYFELAVPTSDGTTLVANLRAVCDGSSC